MNDHHGWHGTLRFLGTLGFLAFALWLCASKFDSSELKTPLVSAGPIAAQAFWPAIRKALGPTTEALSRGQVE